MLCRSISNFGTADAVENVKKVKHIKIGPARNVRQRSDLRFH